jgi:hypothetical protein
VRSTPPSASRLRGRRPTSSRPWTEITRRADWHSRLPPPQHLVEELDSSRVGVELVLEAR